MVSALPRFIQMRAPLPFLNPMGQSWRGGIRDMEAAIDLMRTSGAAKAAKKSGRIAAEGLVIAGTDLNTLLLCIIL
jgi:hypothetical protein